MRASDFVGQRIRRTREARGWKAKDLAERCAEIGAPEITPAVIANIETGRRDEEGRRRREVTVDEMLVLALALELPPVFLFIPLDGDEELRITPSAKMDVLTAVAWVSGDDGAMRYMSGEWIPKTQDDRARWARWRVANRPIDLLRTIWLWIEGIKEGEPPDSWLHDFGGDDLTESLAEMVDWMAGLGFTPPPLPGAVVRTIRNRKVLRIAHPDELLIAEEGV